MEIKGHTISVYVDDNDGQAHNVPSSSREA
jgi:hypothetical protein